VESSVGGADPRLRIAELGDPEAVVLLAVAGVDRVGQEEERLLSARELVEREDAAERVVHDLAEGDRLPGVGVVVDRVGDLPHGVDEALRPHHRRVVGVDAVVVGEDLVLEGDDRPVELAGEGPERVVAVQVHPAVDRVHDAFDDLAEREERIAAPL
jgi:hypothetical protein